MSNIKDFNQFQLERKRLDIMEQHTLKKWLESDDPELLMKAHMHLEDVEKRRSSGVKTIIFDPESRNQGDGYLRKGSSLNFGTLRSMSRTPLISSIIKTRVEQVSEFTTPQADKFQPGFVIRPKKKDYFTQKKEDVKIDKKMQERIDNMVEFMLNCGEGSNEWHGDTFSGFTRKVIPDSLTMDVGSFEVVRNRMGLPVEMIATDGATMRIADTYDDDEVERKVKKINGYAPSFVQVIDGTVRNEYYPWELCFGIRNPGTNIYNNGYGNSELEELMHIVTWMLNSDTYNGNFFSQGASPKGILKVSGNVNSGRLNEFRQSWMAQVAGVSNSHKTPVIESDNMEWIDLQKNNRDMEFSQWQEYLIKVACAMYKIDPSEVFDLQHTNSNAFQGNNKEENVKYSRDKGLKPLLRHFQGWLNKYIVNPRDPELELVFVGLDAESEERELELDIKRGTSFMGLQELRAKHNLPPLTKDDFIMNPTYIQWSQMNMMGGEDSNQAVGDFEEGNFDPNIDMDDETEKSEDSNPFVKELNNFVRKNLMNEPIKI